MITEELLTEIERQARNGEMAEEFLEQASVELDNVFSEQLFAEREWNTGWSNQTLALVAEVRRLRAEYDRLHKIEMDDYDYTLENPGMP